MSIRRFFKICDKKIRKLFTEKELFLRANGKLVFFKVSAMKQVVALSIIFALAAWGLVASATFVISDNIIASKDLMLLKSRLMYRTLLSEITDYQRKFNIVTEDLEKNQSLVLEILGENTELQQGFMLTKTELSSSRKRQNEIASVKDELRNALAEIQQRIGALNARNFEREGDIYDVTDSLEIALNERNNARITSVRSSKEIAILKTQIKDLRESGKKVIIRLTSEITGEIENLEGLIGRTGLKFGNLAILNRQKPTSAQGGPFEPLRSSSYSADILKSSINHLEARLEYLGKLRIVVNKLPLIAPMDYYTISSVYGKRRDPINKRWAMHYGLDLIGPKKTNVFSTAAGIVVKSGYRGRYGKFLEIGHGNGIQTRYGHLSKILVKKGQAVYFRQKIGLIGNTGRSTGRHLHYEIVYQGRPKDPLKFIRAGNYVYKN